LRLQNMKALDVARMRENNKKSPIAKHVDPYGKRLDTPEDDRISDTIEGRNSVLEAIRAGVIINKVFIAKGETDSALRHIASLAREAGAVVSEVDRRKLDFMSVSHAHQGVVAKASAAEYVTVSDILEIARNKNENPLIILCDEVADPHNLGAIIRTAEAAGAHGVVITKHRSAGLTATAAKASSGAVYHMAIARVTNLSSAISELKKAGVWVFGASAEGDTSLWQTDLSGSIALVVGSEGKGISRLVSENCDHIIKIPMFGSISSLNVSVSAAVLIYEAVRQRAI